MKGNEGRIESSLKATFNEATDKNLSKKRKIEDGNDLSGIYADSVKANSTAAANQGVLPSLNKNERVIKPSSLWNFAVDYNDHFETPPTAYKDLSPVLEALAHCVCKTTAELTVYDPYWCEGSMVSHMRELGYENVINRNRDFYMDIKKKNIPGYDILVTNPPYSGEHKVNLLKFLATHTAASSANNSRNSSITNNTPEKSIVAAENKNTNNTDKLKPTTLPFALLLPVYTATKSYWKDFVHAQSLLGKNAFYILPPDYYDIPDIPGYDVLVTNPPYSGEHKVNLLKFLATHTAANSANNSRNSVVTSTTPEKSIAAAENKNTNNADKVKPTTLPFALLLPVYTATKSYWKDFVHAQSLLGKNSFYILPPDYYEYSHPEGTGKDIPPFYSAWFLGGFSTEQKNSIIQSLRTKPRTAIPTKPTNPPLKRLSFPVLTVAESVEALVSRGVVTDSKRPNPKQRQKMKQKGK
eukprot:CAMPEP_0185014246 /NCGR_PEP_ID=MMETSP1098-20130426/99222_1 /TAXON_ID=89044 /ORGANISM="Spumella elongata, Strain CCAP 955/1" /LENGTH=467 /DNA_ID=CAMNT_0027543335 /DNA_START=65 /DNA_END=1469 /DNA_ORIENTATION=+